jgi:hypothetical protein
MTAVTVDGDFAKPETPIRGSTSRHDYIDGLVKRERGPGPSLDGSDTNRHREA